MEACEILVCSLVLSHIDYCNVMLIGTTQSVINKLQRIQNFASKVVLNKRRHDSTRECLKTLHWLLVKTRIEFKVILLMHNCFNDKAPDYLQNIVKMKINCYSTRRSNMDLYDIPWTKSKSLAACSFSVMGPKL